MKRDVLLQSGFQRKYHLTSSSWPWR